MSRVQRIGLLAAATLVAGLTAGCGGGSDGGTATPAKQTELCRLARAGNAEAVRSLLEAGAEANRRAPNGLTPLNAAIMGAKVPVIRMLIAAGADPDLRNELTPDYARELEATGRRLLDTPIANAAATAQRGTLRMLIEVGADPNVEDNGHTPLSLAREGRDPRIVFLLREAGALK